MPTEETSARPSILIVEDEYFIAEDLRRELEDRGATVVGPVGSLDRAVELAAVSELSGAVLDVNLRGEMVWPLAEVLEAKGVPFVFATGYDHVVVPVRFAGAPVVQKPVFPDPLLDALARGDSRLELRRG